MRNKFPNISEYWKLPKERKESFTSYKDGLPNQVVRSAHGYKWFGLCGTAMDSIKKYGIAARCLDLEKFEYECYAPDPDEDDCSIYFITTEGYIEEKVRKHPQLSAFLIQQRLSIKEFFLMEITEKIYFVCQFFDIIELFGIKTEETFERNSIELGNEKSDVIVASLERKQGDNELTTTLRENTKKQERKNSENSIVGIDTECTTVVEDKEETPIVDVMGYSDELDVIEDYSAQCSEYSLDEEKEDNEDYLEDRKGVLYSKDKMALIGKGDFNGYSYSIRSGTKYIVDYAWYCNFLQKDEQHFSLDIIFPDSLVAIGESAFESVKFGNVVMPKHLKSILCNAFSCCEFASLKLNEGLEHIGEGAFRSAKVDSIVIPSTVKYIGGNAFPYDAHIISKSKHLSVGTQFICDKERKKLYCCITNKERLVLPKTIEVIGNNAFQFHDMQDISLGKSLRVIGKSAFFGCMHLKSIILPDTLEVIEDYAFYGCSSLCMITIPSNVKHIGINIFNNCENLSCVISLSPYFEVENDALYDISSKTLLSYWGIDKIYTIREDTKIIGDSAFAHNTIIQRIKIPASVNTIESNAFRYCENLVSLKIVNKDCNVSESAFVGTKFEDKLKKS